MGTAKSKCCGSLGSGELPPSKEPLVVALAGVAGQIGYALLPMIANGSLFGQNQRVIIQGCDLNLPAVAQNMEGITCELLDSNFPLLERVDLSADEKRAFKGADYAILLGAWPAQEDTGIKQIMEKNAMIFKTMGQAIKDHAKKDCKVVLFGPPASSNALICSHFASSVDKSNFSAVTRLLQNRAAGMLAKQTNSTAADLRNIVVWGGACTGSAMKTLHVDIDHCTIAGVQATKKLTSQDDKNWLQKFPEEVRNRGHDIQKMRKASAAISAARAVCDHVHALHCGTRPGEFVSMGIWVPPNDYGIKQGVYASMPVVSQGKGRFLVHRGLTLSEDTKAKLKKTNEEMEKEKKELQQFLS